MTARRFRAALFGAGRIGAGYSDDPMTARHFRYATHAQVLAAHPAIEWVAAIDPSDAARQRLRAKWNVPLVAATPADIPGDLDVEIAVVATPPSGRLDIVTALTGVKGILIEKPIALDPVEARAIVEHCAARGIALQVALWRRADARLQALAAGEMTDLIGGPVAAFGIYGNGIHNNGTHMIDLAQMLLGDAAAVHALGPATPVRCAPLAGDLDLPFALTLCDGIVVAFQPVPFDLYRENALDVWGERGRLEILQEGLRIVAYPTRAHRALSHAREVASDDPVELETTVGEALYRLYDNLTAALNDGSQLWSPGASALRTEMLIAELLQSRPGASPPMPT